MRFEEEVWERYSVAQNMAKRVQRKNAENNEVTSLTTLAEVLAQEEVNGEIELGIYDIPVNQIVGIATDSESECYISDFLPLPSVQSDFAAAWCNLYLRFLNDREISDPILCYEFLGKFYVADGKKRVSVAKVHDSVVIKAKIIRIMPAMSDDPRIKSYYEFVRAFEKTGLYQIAFTQSCDIDKFLEDLGYAADHVWTDNDRWGFVFSWYPFQKALKVAFGGHLNITTADAVQVLIQKQPFAELKMQPSWALAEMMQESWYELYKISNPDFKLRISAA